MPRQETRTLYKLDELKEKFPKTYEAVHERWKNACDASGFAPWQEEIMASLRAVIKACGAELKDWSIGAYGYSYVKVDAENEYYPDDSDDPTSVDHGGVKKDSAWLFDTILRPLGYKGHAEKGVEFPGLCPWTGYCADEVFIQHVYERMARGETLTDALESLADEAREMIEEECEQDKEEESMLANWGDREYTEDGKEA